MTAADGAAAPMQRGWGTRRRRWRRWFLNVHIYGGLACSSYLFVYGISTLLANHRPNPFLGVASDVAWSRPVPMDLLQGEPVVAARRVADALAIAGRIAPNEALRSPAGDLRFKAHRPGADYEVRIEGGVARVLQHRSRLGSVLLGLHDARLERSSRALVSWWLYTAVIVGILLVLVGSGVVAWVSARGGGAWGWRLLAGGPVLFLVLVTWWLA